MVKKSSLHAFTTNIIAFLLLGLPFVVFSRTVGGPGATDSLENSVLGHSECQIRADTNCVTKLVTLEAFAYYVFAGVADPISVPWSTGVTAHRITIAPPGTWSYNVAGIGCDHFFNSITYESPFFSGPIEILGGGNCCNSGPVELTVNTLGYNDFAAFKWNTGHNVLTPYSISAPGTYALTVTDDLGCTFTDAVFIGTEVACPNPPPVGAESCATACVYCDFDGLQGTNNGTPSGGNTICSAIAVHNDQWYGFIAGSDTIDFEIVVSNCQNGDGLQAAIMADCGTVDALVCNPGCTGCGDQTLSLSSTNFLPGQNYWLMVDGYIGDVCDFQINVVNGSTEAPAPGVAGQPAGPAVVCPGAAAVYKIPVVAGAGYYHWTAPAGSSINGGTNNAVFEAPEGEEVTVTFGTIGGQVCVAGGNVCLAPVGQSCLNVAMQPIPATIKAPLEVCFEDLPYVWDEEPYSTIGTFGTYLLTSTPYASNLGCDSIVRQTITVKAPLVTNLPVKFLCTGDCFSIGGESYCDPGAYSVVLESYQGCDSIVNFSIIPLNPVAEIQGPQELLCGQNSITLLSAPSAGTKAWRNLDGQVIGGGNSLLVSAAGTYILTTTVTNGGVQCTQSDTTVVVINPTLLDVQIGGAEAGCTSNPLVLQGNVSVGNAQFSWAGPNGFASSEQNPVVTDLGTYTVTVTAPLGCSGTATAIVTAIGGAPVATAQNDTIVTCNQTNGQLNGGAENVGNSFSWTGPNGFQSADEDPLVTIPGQYFLTVTSAGGCTATTSAYLVEQITPITFEISDGTISCTQSLTLQSGSSAMSPSYQWSGPNGFASMAAQPVVTEPGTYSATITDQASGCTAVADAVVLLNTSLGQPSVFTQNDTINCIQQTGQLQGGPTDGSLFFFWTGPNGFQSVVAAPTVNVAGQYLLTVTNVIGCTATASASLIDQTLPPVVDLAGDTIICSGFINLFPVTTAVAPSYSWSGPNGFTSTAEQPIINDPGSYQVTVTDLATGCTSTADALVLEDTSVIVVTQADIVKPFINQQNGSIDITVAGNHGPFTFNWLYYGLQFATTEDIDSLSPGFYSVLIQDSNGCVEIVNFDLEAISGAQEVAGGGNWKIRPNPSTGLFELCCHTNAPKNTAFRVYDFGGRLLWEQSVQETPSEVRIDLREAPVGVYLLEIKDANGSAWMKLVVQR